jgi:hypothetical protein
MSIDFARFSGAGLPLTDARERLLPRSEGANFSQMIAKRCDTSMNTISRSPCRRSGSSAGGVTAGQAIVLLYGNNLLDSWQTYIVFSYENKWVEYALQPRYFHISKQCSALPSVDPTARPVVSRLDEFGRFIRSERARQGLRIDDAAALCHVSSRAPASGLSSQRADCRKVFR